MKSKQQFRKENSKGDMIKMIQKQQAFMIKQDIAIKNMQEQLYYRDLLCNPCHEPDRVTWLEENKNKDVQ